MDAIAGVDIALRDLFGKPLGQPGVKLLGGRRSERIPAYVSGLPRSTQAERLKLARASRASEFQAFMGNEFELYKKIIQDAGIKAE